MLCDGGCRDVDDLGAELSIPVLLIGDADGARVLASLGVGYALVHYQRYESALLFGGFSRLVSWSM